MNVEPALQIHSKYRQESNDAVMNETRTITDEMNRFNLFIGIGFKYLFTLGKHELCIRGLINFGLFRISKDKLFDVTPDSARGWVDWRAREVLLNLEYYISF